LNWIEELVVSRIANESNVFIVETDDLIRIEQLIRFLIKKGEVFGFRKPLPFPREDKRFEKANPVVIEFDVLGRKAVRYNVKNGKLVKVAVQIQNIFQHGAREPVAYVVHYIYREEHGRMLADTLMSLSNSNEYYLYRSTVFVFAFSRHLFPKNMLTFIPVIKVLPSRSEKEELVRKLSNIYGVDIDPSIVDHLKGLNLKETETCIRKALTRKARLEDAILEAKTKKFELLGVKLGYPKLGLERIGGYDNVKKWIRENVINVVNKLDLAIKLGIGVPRGILFVGPPGTGKTIFCRALAAELKVPLLELQSSQIFSRFLGETEAKIEAITTLANEISPSILFIDEAEQLFQSRARVVSADAGTSVRATAMLISALGSEERKFIMLMTANFPEMLDEALVRRGRIDAVIPILYPDRKAREEILRVHLEVVRKIPVTNIKTVVSKVAEATPFWSGAELEALVIDVAKKKLISGSKSKLSVEDFLETVRKIKIDVDARKQYITSFMENLEKSLRNAPIIKELFEYQFETLKDEIEEARALL